MSTFEVDVEAFIGILSDLVARIMELTEFFKYVYSQQTTTILADCEAHLIAFRAGMMEQGARYKRMIEEATAEAENGVVLARGIIYYLDQIESGSSRDIIGDLLQDVQDRIEIQVATASRVKAGFEEIRAKLLLFRIQEESVVKGLEATRDVAYAQGQESAVSAFGATSAVVGSAAAGVETIRRGLSKLAGKKDALVKLIQANGRNVVNGGTAQVVIGAVFAIAFPVYGIIKATIHVRETIDAWDRYWKTGKQADVVNDICGRLGRAIDTVGHHVNFWSELNTSLKTEGQRLASADQLVQDNGRVRMGSVAASIDTWRQVEELYRSYASATRLSKQVLDAHSIHDLVQVSIPPETTTVE